MFMARVTVMLKKSVLDPQGAAVERALKIHLGDASSVKDASAKDAAVSGSVFGISSVRVGKVVELTIEGPDAESVREKVKALADRLLANPVMEEYTVDVEPLCDSCTA
ncbi:MAG: phosphoribosylformylglycinamidine synthase subunit PurS [Synergistaceae bacterium]|jgi:phosphoribosylformylglycinamidine synthase|nr:phosphoribosylformylglycinamidine synthase subunit PurS [Synergistaceae bacterium]